MNGTIHGKQLKTPETTQSIQDIHQQTSNFNNRKEGIIVTRLRMTVDTKLTHKYKIKKLHHPAALIAITIH